MIERVHTIARKSDCALVVGFVERADDRLYNACAYVRPDDLAMYRKRHLWGSERSLLSPGVDCVVVETSLGPVGLLTCYDLNFVEESAALARRNVQALFVPGAWPVAHVENWRLLLRARAFDGVRWVVGTGRTGRNADGTAYAGNSSIVYPNGRVLTSLGREENDCLATLDPSVLASHRTTVFPDREPTGTKEETNF